MMEAILHGLVFIPRTQIGLVVSRVQVVAGIKVRPTMWICHRDYADID